MTSTDLTLMVPITDDDRSQTGGPLTKICVPLPNGVFHANRPGLFRIEVRVAAFSIEGASAS
jgi:hypothetical protein